MMAEIDLDGVFVPALLLWALRRLRAQRACCGACLRAVGFYRLVWHRALFDLALFVILLGGNRRPRPRWSGHETLVSPSLGRIARHRWSPWSSPRSSAGACGSTTWSEPWTRDGRVRADVVGVAPDVSGLVTEVLVHDNQPVRAGDVLFRVDRARFELALQQAEAALPAARRRCSRPTRESSATQLADHRRGQPGRSSSRPAPPQQADAAYQQAVADRDVAQLNLDRTEVRRRSTASITNFDLRPGDYVTAGHAGHRAGRHRHAPRRRLFRGDQAAAHPARRPRRGAR